MLAEITRGEWKPFCDRFTERHRGWLVTIEVVPTIELAWGVSGARMRTLAADAPLHEIRAHVSGCGCALSVLAGAGEAGTRLLLPDLTRLCCEIGARGEHAGLRADGAAGQTARVRFDCAVRPEVLDGLLTAARVPGRGGLEPGSS